MVASMTGLLKLMPMAESKSGLFEIWYSSTKFNGDGWYTTISHCAAVCGTSEELASKLQTMDRYDFDISVRGPKAYIERRAKVASIKRDRAELESMERAQNNFDSVPF